MKAEKIYPLEAFCRMPWSDSIVLKTPAGPMIQPNEAAWGQRMETGALPYMRVTETHGDSVITMPVDSQLLATSDSCTIEMFLVGRNMLAFQSHPEFTYKDQLLKKVIPYVYPERMNEDMKEKADESFSEPLHSDALIEITRRFLKGDFFDRPATFALRGTEFGSIGWTPESVSSSEESTGLSTDTSEFTSESSEGEEEERESRRSKLSLRRQRSRRLRREPHLPSYATLDITAGPEGHAPEPPPSAPAALETIPAVAAEASATQATSPHYPVTPDFQEAAVSPVSSETSASKRSTRAEVRSRMLDQHIAAGYIPQSMARASRKETKKAERMTPIAEKSTPVELETAGENPEPLEANSAPSGYPPLHSQLRENYPATRPPKMPMRRKVRRHLYSISSKDMGKDFFSPTGLAAEVAGASEKKEKKEKKKRDSSPFLYLYQSERPALSTVSEDIVAALEVVNRERDYIRLQQLRQKGLAPGVPEGFDRQPERRRLRQAHERPPVPAILRPAEGEAEEDLVVQLRTKKQAEADRLAEERTAQAEREAKEAQEALEREKEEREWEEREWEERERIEKQILEEAIRDWEGYEGGERTQEAMAKLEGAILGDEGESTTEKPELKHRHKKSRRRSSLQIRRSISGTDEASPSIVAGAVSPSSVSTSSSSSTKSSRSSTRRPSRGQLRRLLLDEYYLNSARSHPLSTATSALSVSPSQRERGGYFFPPERAAPGVSRALSSTGVPTEEGAVERIPGIAMEAPSTATRVPELLQSLRSVTSPTFPVHRSGGEWLDRDELMSLGKEGSPATEQLWGEEDWGDWDAHIWGRISPGEEWGIYSTSSGSSSSESEETEDAEERVEKRRPRKAAEQPPESDEAAAATVSRDQQPKQSPVVGVATSASDAAGLRTREE